MGSERKQDRADRWQGLLWWDGFRWRVDRESPTVITNSVRRRFQVYPYYIMASPLAERLLLK